jgi:nucleotide-binding universal stress UspA family protein
MKKIIVPIDFSDCSINALNNAALIANALQMELVICHALMAPAGFASEIPISTVDMGLEAIEKQAKENILKLINNSELIQKVPHHYEVQYGALSSYLEKLTSELEDVALVVMGTHGAEGLQKMLLGSNAFHIMRHLNCPVIALPEKTDLRQMKHLAFAIECDNMPSHDIITMVVALTKSFFGELHLIHIDNQEVYEKRQLEVARGLEKYLRGIAHKFHFKQDENVNEGLVAFTKEQNIDLLMMVAKHRPLLERLKHKSHTKKMMMDIPTPLMVFHD